MPIATARKSMLRERSAGTTARPRAASARAVGTFVPRLTQKAFEKYGFSAATLLTDWGTIVGPQLAAFTAPDRLKWPRHVEACGDVEAGAQGRPGATLMLRVDGGRALDIEYRKRELIERINGYFGYRAVTDLRILQAPVGAPSPREVAAPRRPLPASSALPEVAGIANEALRGALERMQAGIAARATAR
jgi:hypothetical protein